jgi:hypothetical protein
MEEAIIETITLILFRYPGALIRWCLTGFRKPFKEVLNRDGYTNGVIGVIGIVVIVLFVKNIIDK